MPDVLAPILKRFDEGRFRAPVVGMHVKVSEHKSEVPVHRHRRGQLVFAIKGGVTCETPNSMWMVPPCYAVWIPGQVPHSVRATANARICYLFLQPGVAPMPEQCCTLAISSLVRELILFMTSQPVDYAADSPTGRKAVVLLEELACMPQEQLHLHISSEPRISLIAKMLSDNPGERRTLGEWGREVAMSERSLARLVRQETGMTFGRWRQQFQLIIAMRQLAAGQRVQQVADWLGYDSVTAFITMFKKAVGTSPGRYFSELDGIRTDAGNREPHDWDAG